MSNLTGAITDPSKLHGLTVIDASCSIGIRYVFPARTPEASADDLLSQMDRFGIAEACPSFSIAGEYCIEEGNRALLGAVADRVRLHAVWIVAPHHTGEALRPEALLEAMRRHNVRAGKLILHSRLGYLDSLDVRLCEDLLDAFAAHRIPLMLDFLSFSHADTRDLRELLENWPDLPVVVTFPKLEKEERMLYGLWEKFAQLRATLSGYQLMGGIEKVVRHFGPGALVYGSHYPFFTPLQSLLQLIYSDIDREDKQRIAGRNMRELLDRAWC
jgi:hypothetical protein